MYYEEKVIDGILCHRGTPNGEWIPYTLQDLTTAFVFLKHQHEQQRRRANIFKARNIAVLDILQGHKSLKEEQTGVDEGMQEDYGT